jgi:glycosyltransferase involved in cell wall biosynthesis
MSVRPSVIVATPAGLDPGPLALALGSYHPDHDVHIVGRNQPGSVGDHEPLGLGWNRLSLILEPRRYALYAAIASAHRLIESGAGHVFIVLAGSAIASGPLSSLEHLAEPLVVPARSQNLPGPDGLAPTRREFLEIGRFSTIALLARPTAIQSLSDMQQMLVVEPDLPPGRIIELLSVDHDIGYCRAPDLAVGAWKEPDGPISLLAVEEFDPTRPWLLIGRSTRPRVLLSEREDLRHLLWGHANQIGGDTEIPVLPSGEPVDETLRQIMTDSVRQHLADGTGLFPDPFVDEPGFRAWVNEPDAELGRYWSAVYRTRPDLRAHFPEVALGRYDRFRSWATERVPIEFPLSVIETFALEGYEMRGDSREPGGVNVIGYLDRTSGIGMEAADFADALELVGVPVSRVGLGDSRSPLVDDPPALDQRLVYDTNLVVVTAEQFSRIPVQMGIDPFHERRTIAYWFWELSEPSDAARDAAPLVDEVWAPSEFVHAAFSQIDGVRVRLAPPAAPDLERPIGISRNRVGLPDDRFVFLCTLDLFSVVERKNPIGVIEAFRLAFEPDEGPVLVIKTLNGDQRGDCLERILLATDDRPDIILRDASFTRSEQLALIAEADVLVSLHRSEGYGLHLVEAMTLSTPIIATSYSGPVDFLDETCAAMIPYELVPVVELEGAYSARSHWAEPDLGAAATAMRRLYDDPGELERLASRALERVRSMPGLHSTGLRMRAMLERGSTSSTDQTEPRDGLQADGTPANE